MTAPSLHVAVRPLSPADWPAVEALFGPKGACGGCWCMWWRVPRGGKLWEAAKGEPNREAFRELVTGREVHGVLAFDDAGAPAGWCSIGPKESFPRLLRSRALPTEVEPGLWSVVCFYIPAKLRRRGVARALLAGAVELARERGAGCLEAYPVVPTAASGTMPGAFAWTGVPALFEAAGFEPLPGRERLRPVYRRRLGPAPRA